MWSPNAKGTRMKMPPESKMNHRRSIRLRGYDYSREGGYFITLCAQNRELFFEPGPVQGMLKSFWDKISEKFPMVQVDKFVVMPNHVHGIIMIGCRADEMGEVRAVTRGRSHVGANNWMV